MTLVELLKVVQHRVLLTNSFCSIHVYLFINVTMFYCTLQGLNIRIARESKRPRWVTYKEFNTLFFSSTVDKK